MEAAALPEDQAQKYILAVGVSNSNVNALSYIELCESVSNSNFFLMISFFFFFFFF